LTAFHSQRTISSSSKTDSERPKAIYGIARAAQATGDKATAHQRYQQFLTLRKNADPHRPEVTTAKERSHPIGPKSGLQFSSQMDDEGTDRPVRFISRHCRSLRKYCQMPCKRQIIVS